MNDQFISFLGKFDSIWLSAIKNFDSEHKFERKESFVLIFWISKAPLCVKLNF